MRPHCVLWGLEWYTQVTRAAALGVRLQRGPTSRMRAQAAGLRLTFPWRFPPLRWWRKRSLVQSPTGAGARVQAVNCLGAGGLRTLVGFVYPRRAPERGPTKGMYVGVRNDPCRSSVGNSSLNGAPLHRSVGVMVCQSTVDSGTPLRVHNQLAKPKRLGLHSRRPGRGGGCRGDGEEATPHSLTSAMAPVSIMCATH